MKWYWAILFTIFIMFVALFISGIIGFNLVWIMVFFTAIWAAIDSKSIELKKYKSGISYGPVLIFIAIFMLWIVGFPWYLHMRYKIKNGLAELKEVTQDEILNTESSS